MEGSATTLRYDYLGGPPHPVMRTIRSTGDHIRVLLHGPLIWAPSFVKDPDVARLLLSKPLQRKMAVKCWQRLPRLGLWGLGA